MFFGRKKDASEAWAEGGKSSELRIHPRMGLKTLVTVRLGNKEAHCRLFDISLGGLAFHAPWPLDPNDLCTITLPPPEGIIGVKAPKQPAVVDARVRRVVPSQKYPGTYQTGAQFVNPSPEAGVIIRLWFESFGEAPEKRSASRR